MPKRKTKKEKDQDSSREQSGSPDAKIFSDGTGDELSHAYENHRVENNAGKAGNIRIYTWNVNGLRAVAGKTLFPWIEKENPDIICFQETKSTFQQIFNHPVAGKIFSYPYHSYWMSAQKKGYSGVATFSRIKPVRYLFGFPADHPERNFNQEGRIVITEFDTFILWNVYFPNGQRGPERVRYKLEFYDYCLNFWEKQRKEKYLIIAGDFNTAHKEIDLARPEENKTVSGFLPEERAFLDKLVSMGYVDVFRYFDPSPGKYTYWDPVTRARERNIGWRIDYFFVSEETLPVVKNCYIQDDVFGSDHCPVVLEISPN